MKNNFSWIGAFLIIFGILFFYEPDFIRVNNLEEMLAYPFLVISLLIILFFLDRLKNSQIIVTLFLFFAGLLLIVTRNYEILFNEELILPVFLVYIATLMLLLYIKNSGEKLLLILSILFFGLGGYFLVDSKFLFPLNFAGWIFIIMLDYWQIILIIFGFYLLLRKRN